MTTTDPLPAAEPPGTWDCPVEGSDSCSIPRTGHCTARCTGDDPADWYDTRCPTCDAPEPTHTPMCAVPYPKLFDVPKVRALEVWAADKETAAREPNQPGK